MPEEKPERMSIEVIEVSPRIVVPPASSTVAGEVFRQLLQQAIRVADQANSQAVRMASDFAEVYRREQAVRLEYETKLREMRLLERQSTRYAEDLATMLRSERERREQLETALEAERVANEELRRTGLQGISHLLLAATIKDQTTGAHLLRVRKYVEAIGTRLGLPAQIVEEFGYSSVMHDVGKIHTPDHILQSEHHLSSEEFEVIKQHCIDGEVMLGSARFFETARAIAREHHERWDGRGYPDGKKGDGISLAARIVSVADVFDALTSKRPYKTAWTIEEGMAAVIAGIRRAVRSRGRRCLPGAPGRRQYRARQAGGRDRSARLSLRPVHASAPPPTTLAAHESATKTPSATETNQSGHRCIARDQTRDNSADDDRAHGAADEPSERARKRHRRGSQRGRSQRGGRATEIDRPCSRGVRPRSAPRPRPRDAAARWLGQELVGAHARLHRADRDERAPTATAARDPPHDSSSSPRMNEAPTNASAATEPTKSHAAQKPKVCTANPIAGAPIITPAVPPIAARPCAAPGAAGSDAAAVLNTAE